MYGIYNFTNIGLLFMINVNVGKFIPCYGYIHINPCKIWAEASSLSGESWLFQNTPETTLQGVG